METILEEGAIYRNVRFPNCNELAMEMRIGGGRRRRSGDTDLQGRDSKMVMGIIRTVTE